MIKKSVYILFLVVLNLILGKDVTDFKIEHLSIEQGLSQNTVRSIIQDKQGFLWFATED